MARPKRAAFAGAGIAIEMSGLFPMVVLMAWIYLVAAGLLEIAWAAGLKVSNGFSRLWPSIITVVLMILSFLLLGRAVRSIPVGTAYAAWTGIGAVGTAVVGIIFFGESRELSRLLCILLIISGVVGLKYVGE